MTRYIIRLSLFILILCILFSCNTYNNSNAEHKGTFSSDTAGDKLYTTDLEDTAMNNAIKFAKTHLDLFDKALTSGNTHFDNFYLKKRYSTPNGGSEHIWISNIEIVDDGYRGIVSNDPINTHEIKYGDTVLVSKNDITDWSYLENDTLRGGYTMRMELKRMAPKEKADFLKHLDYKIRE